MPKRLLDCCASDFRGFSKADLLESIQKSEGRVIACETIGTVQPLLGNVTNAEFAASMGADILLLNLFDVQHPVVQGLPETPPEETIRLLKKLTGRPVGINLERHADAGRPRRHRRNPPQFKARERTAGIHHFAFALHHVDRHRSLTVLERRKVLRHRGRNRRVAGNDFLNEPAHGFKPQRKRRHIEKQPVVARGRVKQGR